jgi:uncharacterized protein YbjQ (UPF0145 family)
VLTRKADSTSLGSFKGQGVSMNMIKLGAAALAASLLSAPAAAGDKKKETYVVVNEEYGVPVFAGDIPDRPYEVIGEIKAGVRKATIFSKDSSEKKIYRELWERARKKGADAVINATYGDAKITAISWGQTNAKGTAIRFTKDGAAARIDGTAAK